MMALAPLASMTDPEAVQIERAMESNGHSRQSSNMTSLSPATTPAIELVWSSAAGVPKASHPLRLHLLQAGRANKENTKSKEVPRTRAIA